MELELGVLAIERKNTTQGSLLGSWLDHPVLPEFSSRTLPIDTAVARRCTSLYIPDQRGERGPLIAAVV